MSVVVARSAYERVGGFHPDLVNANDWEMWARLSCAGPVGWVGNELLEQGEWRLATENAVRAFRIVGSPDVGGRAWAIIRQAVTKRFGG